MKKLMALRKCYEAKSVSAKSNLTTRKTSTEMYNTTELKESVMKKLLIALMLLCACSFASPVFTPMGSTSELTPMWQTTFRDFSSSTNQQLGIGWSYPYEYSGPYVWTNHIVYNFEVFSYDSSSGIKIERPNGTRQQVVYDSLSKNFDVLEIGNQTSAFYDPNNNLSTARLKLSDITLKVLDNNQVWQSYTLEGSIVTDSTSGMADKKWATISGVDFSNGFSLTGKILIDWRGSAPSDNLAAFTYKSYLSPVPELSMSLVVLIGMAFILKRRERA